MADIEEVIQPWEIRSWGGYDEKEVYTMTHTKHTPTPCTECSEQPKCKLHAAAPELLASAKEWLELWFFVRDQYPEIELPNTLREDGTDACGRLRAAIAKAEGKPDEAV